MAIIGIGIDIGADSAKIVAGQMKKDLFVPQKAAVLKRSPDHGLDLAPFLNGLGIKGSAYLGVTGRDMIIRYTQVPPMPDWQLKQVMGFEIQDLASQSGGNLSADFNRLDITSSLSEDDTVLLTLIKNELLDETTHMLAGSKVTTQGYTPNSIALFNLLSRTANVDAGTSLIVDLGSENIDIAIVQDGALIFARNLSGGSALFDQAIVDSFNMGRTKAEKVKCELGCILTRGTAKGLTPQREKVGRSLSSTAGQIYSMIQSSLMFCKAQIKVADLALDRVFLTGGGAKIQGLDRYLEDNLDVPVELYDPSEMLDLSQLEDPSALSEEGMKFSSAVGLALMSAATDHYSIQVLPEAVKKQHFFKTHTVFGLLAAILLLVFLGVEFYYAMGDAELLERDISRRRTALNKKRNDAAEMERFQEENKAMVDSLNLLDEKIIPTTGLVRTWSLIQKYLPEDLWITSIELDREEREELKQSLVGRKRPIVRVKGSGKEMGQHLQISYKEFKQKLDQDPLTRDVISQVRYGEEFSFTLIINFSVFPEVEAAVTEEDES